MAPWLCWRRAAGRGSRQPIGAIIVAVNDGASIAWRVLLLGSTCRRVIVTRSLAAGVTYVSIVDTCAHARRRKLRKEACASALARRHALLLAVFAAAHYIWHGACAHPKWPSMAVAAAACIIVNRRRSMAAASITRRGIVWWRIDVSWGRGGQCAF